MDPRPDPAARTLRGGLLLAVLLAAATCGDATGLRDVRAVVVSPPVGLAVGIGSEVRFSAETLDGLGEATFRGDATWTVADPSVAAIDESGLTTARTPGITSVTATVAGLSGTATLEVYVPETVSEYVPGTSYFGRGGYIEYVPGELPVILSAPHGGRSTPDEISNRTWGVTGRDRNTIELTLAIRDALVARAGSAPHVVVSHLDRAKLDPNREIEEAAQDDAYAERAWEEFHGFVERARTTVRARHGGGMYFDMHGHGHARSRLELGYLLSSSQLNRPDASLNSLAVVQTTSVRELGRARPSAFAELIRGRTSLGGFLEAEGVATLPGPSDPFPFDDPYFTGGYGTRRHGSIEDSEVVSGIQIEHHYTGLRDTEESRRAYAERLARAVEAFMLEHFGFFRDPS